MNLRTWLGPSNRSKSFNEPIVSERTPMHGTPTFPARLHSDRHDAVMQQDAETTKLFAAGGSAAGVPAFQESPASGTTTLLDHARREVGFDPTKLAGGSFANP